MKGGEFMRNPLANFMDSQGKDVKEVAADLGVSTPSVYGWLAGNVMPSHGNLRKISRYIGATSHALLMKKWKNWFDYHNSRGGGKTS